MLAETPPVHIVSCVRLAGPCCSSCHEDEGWGYDNLYIEDAEIADDVWIALRYCCQGGDRVQRLADRLIARCGGSGRRR